MYHAGWVMNKGNKVEIWTQHGSKRTIGLGKETEMALSLYIICIYI